MKIGLSSVDITPRKWVPGILMAGFDIGRRATGVLDTLEAGAIYIRDGESEMILITVDAIGLLNPVINRIRKGISSRLGRGLPILVASTHTHAGPDTLGLWGKGPLGVMPLRTGVNSDYMDHLVESVVIAGLNAVDSAAPSGLRIASMDVPKHWVRNDRVGGAMDRAAWAMAVTDPDGEYRAVMVNFSAHPEVLWEDNTMISADYPASFRRRIRDRKKGVPLFFSGDLGGMLTPNCPEEADFEQRRAFADKLGKSIADLALKSLEKAPEITNTRLDILHTPMTVPVSNLRFRLARKMGILNRDFPLSAVLTEAWVFSLAGIFTAVTCPGELVPELGLRVRKLAGPGPVLLLGLCCDELGYILEDEQFSSHEYAYEQTMSCGPEFTARYMEKVEFLLNTQKINTRKERKR